MTISVQKFIRYRSDRYACVKLKGQKWAKKCWMSKEKLFKEDYLYW